MPPLLATADPNPTIAWNVVLTIGVLVTIAMNVISLFKKSSTAITPDPLRVEKLDRFATRDFCETQHNEVSRRLDGHDSDIRAIYGEIKQSRAEGETHAGQRSATLHRKIEEVRSELNVKLDDLRAENNQGFKDVERAIGRIEGRQH